MPTRPILKNITLTYEKDGQTFTKDIDPTQATALFWEDYAVENLLASFYRPDHPTHRTHPTLTEPAIMSMWHAPQADGNPPLCLIKDPNCGTNPV